MIYYHDSSSSSGDEARVAQRQVVRSRHRTPDAGVRVREQSGGRSVIEMRKPPGDPVHLKVQLLTAADRQVEVAVSKRNCSRRGGGNCWEQAAPGWVQKRPERERDSARHDDGQAHGCAHFLLVRLPVRFRGVFPNFRTKQQQKKRKGKNRAICLL
uniref:Uncharacterized protein n=1 Tax=Anopheles melas TaxID=34690 RepID=A0A182UCV0_9DIPT